MSEDGAYDVVDRSASQQCSREIEGAKKARGREGVKPRQLAPERGRRARFYRGSGPQTAVPEAGVAPIAHHEMIEDADIEQGARRNEALGELDILPAWLWIAARMIVEEDCP